MKITKISMKITKISMKILRTFAEPTDVYIIGTDFREEREAFSLTDDYCSFTVQSGANSVRLESDGFVFVLTRDELLAWKDKMWGSWEDQTTCEGVRIIDFVGDVYLKVLTDSGKNITEIINLADYIYHQCPIRRGDEDDTDEEITDVIVEIEPGFILETESIADIYKNIL